MKNHPLRPPSPYRSKNPKRREEEEGSKNPPPPIVYVKSLCPTPPLPSPHRTPHHDNTTNTAPPHPLSSLSLLSLPFSFALDFALDKSRPIKSIEQKTKNRKTADKNARTEIKTVNYRNFQLRISANHRYFRIFGHEFNFRIFYFFRIFRFFYFSN